MTLKDIAVAINAAHREACAALHQGAEHARRAGELLLAAKERLSHGDWLPWLAEHCAVSVRTAQAYMRIAREWTLLQDRTEANAQRVTHLPMRQALAILAEPERDVQQPTDANAAGILRAPWKTVPLAVLTMADGGWRYDDPRVAAKLAASLRRYGQLTPLLVRQTESGAHEAVDGRKRLAVMRELGFAEAVVRDLGALSGVAATEAALACEVGFQTDYARIASTVAALVAAGIPIERLAEASPFDAEQLAGFVALMHFEWSQFSRAKRQRPGTLVNEFKVVDEDLPTDYCCPACGYEWSGSAKPNAAGAPSPKLEAALACAVDG